MRSAIVCTGMSGSWTEETLAALRSRGLRNGGARRAVVDLLGRQDCCVSAQEIFDRLRDEGRSVGIASVYRTLEQLAADGYVQRVDVGAGGARYEPVLAGGDHHHHLVCDDCGKVEAFHDLALERAIEAVERDTGYAVVTHDVVLRGACTDCRSAA